jgi:hypothetical protein
MSLQLGKPKEPCFLNLLKIVITEGLWYYHASPFDGFTWIASFNSGIALTAAFCKHD